VEEKPEKKKLLFKVIENYQNYFKTRALRKQKKKKNQNEDPFIYPHR